MRSIALCVALLALFVPVAAGQSVTMEPSQLAIGTTDRVTFGLALPAGRFTVAMEMPAFVAGRSPFGSRDPLDPYGTPFTPAGSPIVSAGATVSGGEPGTAGLGNVCRRGFDAPANPFAMVTMPPGGGRLAWGFWLSEAQRWSATDYRVSFRVRGEDGSNVLLTPPPPAVTGAFGTRFRFSVRRLRRGVYRVAGTTQPVLARGRVSVMSARSKVSERVSANFPSDFTRGRSLAALRTDARGRFGYTWRPRRGGLYAIWMGAFATSERLHDSSCPLRIRARM